MSSQHLHAYSNSQISLPQGRESERGWHLHVFPTWQKTFRSIADVCTILQNPEKILQGNNRGIVLLVRHKNLLFIAKRSLIQENRRWAQFTSVYRQGEGTRTLRSMAQMYEAGLPVPEPVLVLEKKRFGFVVASWSVYRYLEGQPCTCAQAAQVAATLKNIHQHGWVHRDPHVKNFLIHHGEIRFIDCARARPWHSRYAQMYDVVLLNNCCPGSLQQYGISAVSRVYRLAKFQNNMIKRWRKIKRHVRSFFRSL